VERGYFFALQWKGWDPLREVKGSARVLAENERLKEKAAQTAKMRYIVHLPDGYTSEKRWPLMLTMHCDSGFMGNIEGHQQYWKPDASLDLGFITVYVQSSQILSSKGYEWTANVESRREDIKRCCKAVVEEYSVDTGKVILSGFSGGALAAMDVSLNAVLPSRGFIALGPDVPENFSIELCVNARERGVRGVLIEGELSDGIDQIREMDAVFRETGLPCELYINQGIGHWYPDDLSDKISKAIAFILEE
jgi:predicted esterase